MSKSSFKMLQNLLLLFVAVGVSALPLPSDFTKCKRDDPKLNDCIKSAYKQVIAVLAKGLPEFGADSIAPLVVGHMKIDMGEKIKVVQNFENSKFYNYELAAINDVQATVTDSEFKISLKVFAKNVWMGADYNFDGEAFGIPVTSKGKCHVSLENTKIDYHLIGEFFEKDGTKYVEIKTFLVKLDTQHIVSEFIDDNDAVTGDALSRLVNDNGLAAFADVIHGYERHLADGFKRIVNNVLTKVPYDDLFLA